MAAKRKDQARHRGRGTYISTLQTQEFEIIESYLLPSLDRLTRAGHIVVLREGDQGQEVTR